jgi:hypothetical protein
MARGRRAKPIINRLSCHIKYRTRGFEVIDVRAFAAVFESEIEPSVT